MTPTLSAMHYKYLLLLSTFFGLGATADIPPTNWRTNGTFINNFVVCAQRFINLNVTATERGALTTLALTQFNIIRGVLACGSPKEDFDFLTELVLSFAKRTTSLSSDGSPCRTLKPTVPLGVESIRKRCLGLD